MTNEYSMYEPFSKEIARGLVSLSEYIHPETTPIWKICLKIQRPENQAASICSTLLKWH